MPDIMLLHFSTQLLSLRVYLRGNWACPFTETHQHTYRAARHTRTRWVQTEARRTPEPGCSNPTPSCMNSTPKSSSTAAPAQPADQQQKRVGRKPSQQMASQTQCTSQANFRFGLRALGCLPTSCCCCGCVLLSLSASYVSLLVLLLLLLQNMLTAVVHPCTPSGYQDPADPCNRTDKRNGGEFRRFERCCTLHAGRQQLDPRPWLPLALSQMRPMAQHVCLLLCGSSGSSVTHTMTQSRSCRQTAGSAARQPGPAELLHHVLTLIHSRQAAQKPCNGTLPSPPAMVSAVC